MPSTVEEIGPLLRRVTITILPESIRSALDRHYRALARETTLPGFRKGKAPRKVLERRFGDDVSKEVKKQLVTDAVTEAFETHRIEPVEAPELDPKSVDLATNEPIELVFDLEVRPQIDFTDYLNIPVAVPRNPVAEEEVGQALESLRRSLAHLERIEGGPVAPGDVLQGDVRYQFLDGTQLPERPNRIADLRAGQVDRIPIDNLTGDLVGKMPGDTVRLSGKIPEGFDPPDRVGQTAVIQYQIRTIHREEIPELNEELARRLKLESVDELRDRIHQRLIHEREYEWRQQVEEQCLERILERIDIDVPPKLLEREAQLLQTRMRENLERAGVDNLEIQRRVLEFEEDSRKMATRSLRVGFLLDHVAEREQLTITEKDFEEQMVAIARSAGRPPEEIFEDYQQAGLIPAVLSDIKRRKARDFLRTKARIAGDEDPENAPAAPESTATESRSASAGASDDAPAEEVGSSGEAAAPEDRTDG